MTKLRTDPAYITIYVNWFLLFATGVIPMGSLIYLNSRIYAKILETRRLRERCKIQSSTAIAMKDMKNGTTNSSPAVSPNAHPPPQHTIQNAKRHEAMSARDFKMARVLLSIVLVFFICHLLRFVIFSNNICSFIIIFSTRFLKIIFLPL